mgnify:CR=1 FL=1
MVIITPTTDVALVAERGDLWFTVLALGKPDGGVKNEELQTLRDLKVDIAVQGGAIFAK